MGAAARQLEPQAAGDSAEQRPHLRAAFQALSPEALLEHFRSPRRAKFFPVPDAPETSPAKIEGVMAGHFEFNGETHSLGTHPDWLHNPSADLEWHILLHKFYYAPGLGIRYAQSGLERYAERWVELTSSWMESVPVGVIAADVTGRRVQNWIYAYHYFVVSSPGAPVPAGFHLKLLASIERHVEYLCEHLTAKRNHRTLELHAIFLAAVAFPEFERADFWRDFALGELIANARADLLADGVHCELSSDYHHLVLKNYLSVRRLAAMNDIAVAGAFDERLSRALDFSMHVHKPDGIVPSLSDGDACSYLELLRQGHELFGRPDWLYVASGAAAGVAPRETLAAFADAGYYVLRSGWGKRRRRFRDEHYLVFDCGPLGEGNHGHLDCLSFELAANGRSLIVDPGRYTYSEAGDVNWRAHFRGTSAHNTVTVDNLHQTRYLPREVDVGSRHRPGSVRHRIAGPAPRAEMHACQSAPGFGYLCGSAQSHEYDALHTRHILFAFDEYWLVVDRLCSGSTHRYDLRFQLSEMAESAWQWREAQGTRALVSPGLTLAFDARAIGELEIEPGHLSYVYGTRLPAPRLRATQKATATWFHTVIWPGPTPSVPVGVRVLSSRFAPCTTVQVRRPGDERLACDEFTFGPSEPGLAVGTCRVTRFDAAGRAIGSHPFGAAFGKTR